MRGYHGVFVPVKVVKVTGVSQSSVSDPVDTRVPCSHGKREGVCVWGGGGGGGGEGGGGMIN